LLGSLSEIISSQASKEEGSTTIPKGSTAKWLEVQSISLRWRYGLICIAICSGLRTGQELTSLIENNVVQGEVDTFLGFNFIRTERIGVDSNSDHKVLYFAQDGLLLALGQQPQIKISERPDKNHSTQIFASMVIGATRMEESKVGYIECDPS
jgi:hypothetical protein